MDVSPGLTMHRVGGVSVWEGGGALNCTPDRRDFRVRVMGAAVHELVTHR